ncbi:MAG TPA: signal peptidase I [Bacillota bacterium]|nr:signal peptidase I [Bacillota bacterium]
MDNVVDKVAIDLVDKGGEGDLIFPTEKRYKPSKKRGTVRAIGNVLSWLLIVFLMLLLLTLLLVFMQSRSDGSHTLLGYQIYAVRSNSMSPAFDTGSLIVTEQIDTGQIELGDIITYKQNSGATVTHRVIDIIDDQGRSFLTRGDANIMTDLAPVAAEAVLGRVVVFIPYLGHLIGFAGTKAGIALLLIVPGLAILLHQTRSLVSYLKKKKQSSQQAV